MVSHRTFVFAMRSDRACSPSFTLHFLSFSVLFGDSPAKNDQSLFQLVTCWHFNQASLRLRDLVYLKAFVDAVPIAHSVRSTHTTFLTSYLFELLAFVYCSIIAEIIIIYSCDLETNCSFCVCVRARNVVFTFVPIDWSTEEQSKH